MNSDVPHRDLLLKTARDIVQLLAEGEISPLELLEVSFRRIEETDGALNALPTRCFERAREQAKRIEGGDPSDGGSGSWLGGLPVAVKDLNDVAGVRTTYGSTVFADHVPERSDYTVERLESNGAIIVAKSNTPEFGAGGATFNDVFGTTGNPWNTSKNPGGSSGGSAAAVAARLSPIAVGSDTGGSVRQPAAFCGIVGLKPTYGRVSRYGLLAFASSLDQISPLALTVSDAATLLQAIAGQDPCDATSAAEAVPAFDAALREPVPHPTIGVPWKILEDGVDPNVRTAFFGSRFASTDVIAAVSVVFPWSICPIVPIFTCGFDRSNFSFAIVHKPLYKLPASLGPDCVRALRQRLKQISGADDRA